MNPRQMARLQRAWDLALRAWSELHSVMDELLEARAEESKAVCPKCYQTVSTYDGSFNRHSRVFKKKRSACPMSYEPVPQRRSKRGR